MQSPPCLQQAGIFSQLPCLGGGVEFKAIQNPACFLRLKGFVKRGREMGIEIIQHHHEFLCVREVYIAELFDAVCPIDTGTGVRHLDMPPAFQRSKHHKQIAHPVPFIFRIVACWVTSFHRQRKPGFFPLLLTRFIETPLRIFLRVGTLIPLQHIFHRTDKLRIGFWGNTPTGFQPRLKLVFFRTWRIVSAEMLSKYLSSTLLSANRRNVHRTRPSGGAEQAMALNCASWSPSPF